MCSNSLITEFGTRLVLDPNDIVGRITLVRLGLGNNVRLCVVFAQMR